MSHVMCWSLLFGILLLPLPTATAQLAGSRGGVLRQRESGLTAQGIPPLSLEIAQGYITIEGQVEVRVKPTQIRVVLAVTAEGKTPAECKRQVNGSIGRLTTAWKGMGIRPENIVEDFIAVLPRYGFEIVKMDDREVAVEKRVGYLMQSNLHVAVKDDAQAMRAIGIAFDNNVADIIAFDYWSRELDQVKVKARTAAVKAARDKANALLGALFDGQPPIINLQEATRVYYPESLYESFTNSSDASYQAPSARRGIAQIRTFRPKNTYYRGLHFDGDSQSKELPMRPEISVVSTVRLYYQSPAALKLSTSTDVAGGRDTIE